MPSPSLNTGKSLVLVDSGAASCFGSYQVQSNEPKASGYQPEQVDTIDTYTSTSSSCLWNQ